VAVRRYRSEAEAFADAQRNVQIVAVALPTAVTYDCHLTPVDIVAVPGISLPLTPWTKAHWEFRIDPRRGSKGLVPATICANGIDTNGIWRGGLTFPRACAQWLKESSSFQLMEAGIWALVLPKTRFPGELLRPKQTHNLKRSVQYVRYWYAVPFCSNHSIDTGAVTVMENSGMIASSSPTHKAFWRIRLQFNNRDYGKAFEELNGLRGLWVTASWLWLRYLGFLAVPGGLVLYAKYDEPSGLVIALTGVSGFLCVELVN
jgi:hypothetical protein